MKVELTYLTAVSVVIPVCKHFKVAELLAYGPCVLSLAGLPVSG